jgi:hypothetical protein
MISFREKKSLWNAIIALAIDKQNKDEGHETA